MDNAHGECLRGVEPDERLALPIEQRVLLWCMRMWVIEMKRGIGAEKRTEEMLATLGAQSASPCLKTFVFALSRGCTRMIEVQCVCQKRVSLDERALLDALSLMQAMRPFESLLLLRGFVTQAGAEAALRGAEGVGSALAQAGRFLPEPAEDVRHFGSSVGCWSARPVEVTLH